MLLDYNFSVLHSNIAPQDLPCLDWLSGNVSSVPHFLSDMFHAYPKNKMKKYQLNLNRI